MEFTEELINSIKEKYFELSSEDFLKYFCKLFNYKVRDAKPVISLIRTKYNWNRRHSNNYFNWTNEAIDTLKLYVEESSILLGCDKFAKEFNISYNAARDKCKLMFTLHLYTIKESEQVAKIEGWTKYYITNYGNLLTAIRGGYKLLNPVTVRGYKRYSFHEGNHRKSIFIHRLVGEYFIPNPDNKPYIDHIDTNRSNNHYTNLLWVTSSENMLNELTRLHLSIAHDGSSKLFTITIVDNETGELTKVTTMAALYRHFNLEYIPKYVGTLTFRGKTIIMSGEDNDEYYIGKMLRRGNTKEELIDKISNYSENREYKKYLKNGLIS